MPQFRNFSSSQVSNACKMENRSPTLTVETMDISKLKVPDLRRELKSRGLTTTGNKSELMERLQKVLRTKLDSVTSENVDDLEEDLLNEDDDDDVHLDGSESGIADLDSTIEVPAIQKVQKRKSPPKLEQDDQPRQAKKIVLNRSTSSVQQEETQNGLDEDKKNDAEEEVKKVVKLSELSAKERLEMRAKKFGVALPVEARKVVRAERFGTHNSITTITATTISNTTNKLNSSAAPNVDVLKQRAQRFGMSVSPVMTKLNNDEQMEKRKQRFGSLATVNEPLQNDKAKQRLERFKMPVK